MYSEKMVGLGSRRSTIREIFEYGKKRAAVVGAENIFDFSIGNPSVPAPDCVNETIKELIDTVDSVHLHGYTSAQGDAGVRAALAESINRRFGMSITGDNLYITVGAAASLSICLRALAEEGDEFITFAPFFPEYKCFVEANGCELKVVPAQIEDFQINFEEFEKIINKNTKAVIVNSPNNPSGIVYSEETVLKLAKILKEKSEEYGKPIFLIADEPYREIAYDNAIVPYLPKYYDDTFVCYSYSKSLSLPGERIGYIVVPDTVTDSKAAYAAVCGAGRALGYVNAPALFQRVIAKCCEETSDVSIYQKNRDMLYDALIKNGYKCVKPQGAFYLFPQALEEDAYAFCEKAKELDLLLVPGDDFGCKGHVRISYCVPNEMIQRAIPAFEKLAQMYK
ncbi:MAG: pyridoxal phosphate-dependent aminotransferase [Lachnospiraceae bacterium]|nr:pyridoxal phosphate-dependent aminotransferase [Lachnospiraceae bacterium]